MYNLGESSKNNNVNINLGVGGNKVQIHLNDDEDDIQEENMLKSEDKIHIDEDDEEDK